MLTAGGINTVVISSLLLTIGTRGEDPGCPRYAKLGWCSMNHIKRNCPIACAGEDARCPQYKKIGWCSYTHIKNACPVSCADPCTPNPCQNGGTCSTKLSGKIKCACPSGYKGNRCQKSSTSTGQWGEWSEYSACTKDCGGGTSSRSRTCSIRGSCVGSGKQRKPCNQHPCEVAKWGAWSKWTKCSLQCGGGQQQRHRTCLGPGVCIGNGRRQRSCNKQPCSNGENPKCPGYKNRGWCSYTHIKAICTVSCADDGPKWGDWSQWTTCSSLCGGGQQKRHRTCLGSEECVGDREQPRICNSQPCPSGWLKWEKWGGCSKACGPGVRTRWRVCPTSKVCSGSSKETKTCNLRSCTTESAYSPCSRTCGDGVQQKLQGTEYVTRHCKVKNCATVSCGSSTEARFKNSFSCCTKTSMCNRPAVDKKRILYRIIGGTNSARGDWPWMAYISHSHGRCGGSVITTKHILTAAHCLQTSAGVPIAVNTITVNIGLADVSPTNLASYPVFKSFVHPDYDFPDHDIGILELTDPLQFNDYIQPLCLPHGEEVPYDTICIAMGWGISYIGGDTTSNILKNVDLKVVNPNVCVHGYSQLFASSQNSAFASILSFLKGRRGYICAGDLVMQKDSCGGDSGSPLACQRCDNCGWYAAGLVSYGPNPCANIQVPGIYTKVTHHEQWIYHVTGMTQESRSCSTG